MIYLDNSATTATLPQAAETARKYMCEDFFNPSSGYAPAVQVEREVNDARGRLAARFGASANEIVYTSGGTESNNMAFSGVLRGQRGPVHLVCGAVEHPSVYELFRQRQLAGAAVSYAGVNADGSVNVAQLASLLRPDTALVSVMHVNNETGAINDIAAIARAVKSRAPRAIFHVDGVQAFCKLPFSSVPCDLYSISGHKFHAPKGIGALYIRAGTRFLGGQIGGGQERGLRSGTTNVPGVMGMDAALAYYADKQNEKIAHVRACKLRLCNNLLTIPEVMINGPEPSVGAPHVLNLSFLGMRGEVLLHALEQYGVYVSTGSACSAHKKGKNRILESMGIRGIRQEGAVRFSLCPLNTISQMDEAAQIIKDQVLKLRQFKRR
ncbi:MAG: cysteine desulfurase family protein [Bacillota bacterium]